MHKKPTETELFEYADMLVRRNAELRRQRNLLLIERRNHEVEIELIDRQIRDLNRPFKGCNEDE